MSQKVFVLAVALVFMLAASALWCVGFKSGNDLVEYWREYLKANSGNATPGDGPSKSGYYMGYVIGVVDALFSVGRADFVPINANVGQICMVVGRYLDAHPAEWNDEAADIVYRAVLAAWGQKS